MQPLPKNVHSCANWDPSYQSDNIDWYSEYIARHAVLSTSWLRQPRADDGMKLEIRGLAYKNSDEMKIVIAPLSDNSVRLWDVSPSDGPIASGDGCIIAKSKAGLLRASNSEYCASNYSSGKADANTVECVSVDHVRGRAYFAVGNGLSEIDLATLSLVSHLEFESPIAALSEISHGVPLTVATSPSLHMYDPRVAHHGVFNSPLSGNPQHTIHYSSFLPRPHKNNFRVLPSQMSLYGPPQRPLAVVHLPGSNGIHDAHHGAIYVAGRDPSILVYDRRIFPKLGYTIHSGAHLSSLAIMAQPTPALATGDAQCKIIACGEYKGKGSLELYEPSHLSISSSSKKAPLCFKNRTSASSSKLLSASAHGLRILFSDCNGILKWVERDGRTLVRHWNINQSQPHTAPRGIFTSSRHVRHEDEHVARKLLRTGDASSSDDAVLFWTGEKIGRVDFRSKPKNGTDEGKVGEEEEELDMMAEDAEAYQDRMRRALDRQANDVRFVRGLGLRG